MHEQAQAYMPDLVTDDQLATMRLPSRKLEQVLGRLWRLVGDDAMLCLSSLRPALPNEGHMLAALHLARGGMHVTLNFDRGIEDAFALITRRSELPHGAEAFAKALKTWRGAVAEPAPMLRTVTTRAEFDAWRREERNSTLFKPHGGLGPVYELLDVVVEDTEELGGLYPSRLRLIESLRSVERVLITGYGGLDPDVYGPLLLAASATSSTWTTRDVDEQVRADCKRHGIALIAGDPEGLATTALRDLLSEHELAWPELDVAHPHWERRFDGWARDLADRHDGALFAQAWAWLLADAGERDQAISLLSAVVERDPSDGPRLRLAEVCYTRARSGDRERTGRRYRRLIASRSLDWATRAHCILRLGGIARGKAVNQPGKARPWALTVAFTCPLVVLAEQRRRGRRADHELTAAAIGAIGQTTLRAVEQLIWPDVCQARSTKDPRERVFLLVEEAAGAGLARRAVRVICAGWVPQDRGFVSGPAV